MYLVEGFQWNSTQAIIMWVALDEKMFKVIKGHDDSETECTFAVED